MGLGVNFSICSWLCCTCSVAWLRVNDLHFPFWSKPWSCALCIHEQITLLFNQNFDNCFCNFWHSSLEAIVLHGKTMSTYSNIINFCLNWSWFYYFPLALIALINGRLFSHLYDTITENCLVLTYSCSNVTFHVQIMIAVIRHNYGT